MKTLLLFCGLIMAFIACSDNNSDYRAQFIGVYECTKSNRSFEDENFRTEIDDIVIEIANGTDSLITLDGTELLLREDGTTGVVKVGGDIYNLTFEGSTFKLLTYPDVLGQAIGCYIIGENK